MYDKVLVHVDRKRAFEAYVPFLEKLLRRDLAKQVVLTTIVRPCEPTLFGYVLDPDVVAGIDAHNLTEASEFVQRVAQRFASDGIRIETKVLVGDPTETFRDFASAGDFDLVVIAPTGKRYLLTGKPRAFRRSLREVHKPIMILPATPLSAAHAT
jgi:nucleotide-binding universal stress UspA family protein